MLRWRIELTAAMATEKPAWQYPDLWYWSTVSLSKSTSKIREPWHCYSTREKKTHTHTCKHTKAYTLNYKTVKSINNSKKHLNRIQTLQNLIVTFFNIKKFLKFWRSKLLRNILQSVTKLFFQSRRCKFGNIN